MSGTLVRLSCVLGVLLAAPVSACAEVVDRFAVPVNGQGGVVVGPVLDADGAVFWGQGVDAAPGEGNRRDLDLGTDINGESPGWLVRSALPGQRARTIAHDPFPVSGYRQYLTLGVGGGRLALTATSFMPDRYESQVDTGFSGQVGPTVGPLASVGCRQGRVIADGARIVTSKCESRRELLVEDPGMPPVTVQMPQWAVALDAGGGLLAFSEAKPASVPPAEPPRLRLVDPVSGSDRVVIDDGLNTTQVVLGADRTVVAQRATPGATAGTRIDILHPNGTTISIPTAAVPIDLHGADLTARLDENGRSTVLLINTRTGEQRTLLQLPSVALLGVAVGPATIAWARRDCDEVLIERSVLNSAPVAIAPLRTCPTVTVPRVITRRLSRGNTIELPIRCPQGCRGTVDLLGTTGVYARRAVNTPRGRSTRRVRLTLNADGVRRIRKLNGTIVVARYRLTSNNAPVRKASRLKIEPRKRPVG